MKKNFVKKSLASTLALAMVATAMPAAFTTASAAKAPALNRTSKTLYINENAVGNSYDFNISNKVSGSKYKWTTSNKAIATVNSKGLTKPGTKTGEATISCKITLPTKKTKTLKATVTVKENATKVWAKNAPENNTVGIGEGVFDFNSGFSTASGAKATDYRMWEIDEASNTAGATIDKKSGVVNTTKAGEFKVRVRAYQNKEKLAANDTVDSEWMTIKVVSSVKSVAQTSLKSVKVTFDDNMKGKVKASDFAIENKANKVNQQIKDITFSEDGKEVTLNAYVDFTENSTFVLTYAGVEKDFSTYANVVTTLEITPGTVETNKATEIKVTAKNAEGVDITSAVSGDIQISDTENNDGWLDTSNNKLTIFNTGKTAKIKAVYHTYKYDTEGKEIGLVEAETVITAVDKAEATIGSYSHYGIYKSDSTVDISKATENINTISVGDNNRVLKVYAVDSEKNVLSNFTFESGNENILLVGASNGNQCEVKALNEGSTVVLVKDANGKTLWALPVVVKAARKATTISLDKTSVTATNVNDKIAEKTIKVTVKDQYNEVSETSNTDFTLVESPLGNIDSSKVTAPKVINNLDGTITVDAKNATKGTYTFKVTIDEGKKAATFVVNVVEKVSAENAKEAYKFELSSQSADTIIKEAADAEKTVELKVVQTLNGVENADVSTAPAITYVVEKNGVEVKDALVGNEFVLTKKDGNKVVKTAEGTYTITAKKDGVAVAKTAIIVKDTQGSVTFKANSLTTSKTLVSEVIMDTCEFYYNGTTYSKDTTQVSEVVVDSADVVSNGNKVNVRKATVFISIDGVLVPFTVNMGTTFTVGQ